MAESGGDGGFCDGPFWDLDVTWRTDDPDFTPCFHETVLTYIPPLVLFLLLPFQVSSFQKSGSAKLPLTILLVTKLVLTSLLVILPLIDLGWLLLSAEAPTAPVHLVAAAVRVISYCTALGLLLLLRAKAQVTSGTLFLFWLTSAVTGAVTFRSVVRSPWLDDLSTLATPSGVPLLTYTFQFPLVVALLFLNFWADSPPHYKELEEENENPSPETKASFPSKMLFTWFDGMAWKGYRRVLTMQDLWTLNLADRCRGVVPVWDKWWNRQVESKAGSATPQVSILSTLVYSFGAEYSLSALLQLLYTIIQFASPEFVNLLIA